MATTDRVRNKLATQTAGAVAERPTPQQSTAAVVKAAIERQAGAFGQVLPSVVDPQRFSRLVISAIKSTPDLMQCFSTRQGETSVLIAAMQAAALGLEPNTPTQDCWLLPRRNQGTWEANLSIGYRGYMKLARRSGMVKTIFAEVVHEHDEFRWSRGLEADELVHVPAEGDRGPLQYAYAVARFHDGGYAFQVLNRTDVEARRAMSDSWKSEKARPYSPWTKWPAAMWRKSAIRALVPYLDLSPDVDHAIARDEAPLTLNDDGAIDVMALDPGDEDPANSQPSEEEEGGGGTPSVAALDAEPTPPSAPFKAPTKAQTGKLFALMDEAFVPEVQLDAEEKDAWHRRIMLRFLAPALGTFVLQSRSEIDADLAGRMIDVLVRIRAGEVVLDEARGLIEVASGEVIGS